MEQELAEQELRERAALIAELGRSLNSKDVSLDTILNMIKTTIKDKVWTHFLTKVNEEVTYNDTPEDFIRFIQTPRPDGLGSTPETIAHNVKDDKEASRMFRKTIKRQRGGDKRSKDAKEQINTSNRSIDYGTTQSYGLEVLHEKHPVLYEKVVQGELSVNRAMIIAKERKPWASFPIDDIPCFAAAVKRRFDQDELTELVTLLSNDYRNDLGK